jgi:hypothetical protein
MGENLTKEGSVTFWVRLTENPQFSDPASNMTFMFDQDVGGVKLTIVKEKTVVRVVVDNTTFGVSRMETDISKTLEKDMMVAITWTTEFATLYLYGKKVAESVYA